MAKVLSRKRLSFFMFLTLLFSAISIIGCISTTQVQINSGSIFDIVNGNLFMAGSAIPAKSINEKGI
jgi:hypothetical protein